MSYQCISARTALELLSQHHSATVFDVRDSAAYQAGHLAGAANLSQDRLLGWTKRLAKDALLLIYCYHGNASQSYAQMLIDFRFTQVFSVDGGYPALVEASTASA